MLDRYRTRNLVPPDGTRLRRRPQLRDMRWDGTRWRQWSGRDWVRAAYALQPERLLDATPFVTETALTPGRRDRVLDLAVEHQVTDNAATVVHRGRSGAVLAFRRPVSHVAHALLTLLTGGLWGVVWLAMVLARRDDRGLLEIDVWGNVWARHVPAPA